jgi:hypothetical protein
MTDMKLKYACSLACLLPLGCSTTDSTDVATSDIEATMSVDQFVDSIDITVWLDEGEGFDASDVVLAGGDTLSARSERGPLPAFELNELDDSIQSIRVDDVFDEVTIVFDRPSQTPAPASIGDIPDEAAIEAPAQPYSFADGQAELTWSNPLADGQVTYFAKSCGATQIAFKDSGYRVSDTGSLTIPMDELVDAEPGAAGECVTITLVRLTHGVVDPALAPTSTFSVRKDQEVDITVMP